MGGVPGNADGRGKSRRVPVFDESRKEMAHRIATYQTDLAL